MNKTKRMAILKHRRKRKKLEEKRKALLLASGTGVNRTVHKKEIAKPVKAITEILKPKKEGTPAVKKTGTGKEKIETAVLEAVEKVTKKVPARRKKTEVAVEVSQEVKTEAVKKRTSRKKKPESGNEV